MTNSTCSVGACERPTLARTMCATHYSRWHRGGGQIRPKAHISESERRCSSCGEIKHPADFYKKSGGWCAACERSNKRAQYVPITVPLPACYCVECGERYTPFKRTVITCSDRCAEHRRRRFARIESPVYRAMRRQAQVEVVDPQIVFERDDWICQLCHEDIPKEAAWPHLLSATMDHIKPLSLGGEHSYANCQATHFRCNAAKGARYTPPEIAV